MTKPKYHKQVPPIIIPSEVARLEDVSSSAKILYGALFTFPSFNKEGVWASRKTLGKLIGKKPSTVSDLIRILKEKNVLKRRVVLNPPETP